MANRITLRVIILAALPLLFITSVLYAQDQNDKKVKDRSEDMFREMKTGELTLRFINALNGEYVQGAKVFIASKEYETDYEGRVLFEAPIENGAIPVVFQKENFITAEFDLEMMLGTIFQNRISVSPDLQPEAIRIVLDWSDDPRDLDAHLIKQGSYHISYRHKRSSGDGMAKLDRDDINGNGPETITVNQVDPAAIYTYKIHNFSDRNKDNSRELSNNSRATVRIYGDNRLLGTFRIENERVGTEWTVFQIIDGRITPVNTIN